MKRVSNYSKIDERNWYFLCSKCSDSLHFLCFQISMIFLQKSLVPNAPWTRNHLAARPTCAAITSRQRTQQRQLVQFRTGQGCCRAGLLVLHNRGCTSPGHPSRPPAPPPWIHHGCLSSGSRKLLICNNTPHAAPTKSIILPSVVSSLLYFRNFRTNWKRHWVHIGVGRSIHLS
jgi:hypothetical protein